jgi:uncharacterized protein (TIGR00266 family)
MHTETVGTGAFAALMVHLNPGESFVSESGAMFRASNNIDIDVTTKAGGGGGGLLGGLKRLLASENFFFSTYSVTDNYSGEVGLAPTHAGEVRVVDVNGDVAWLCTGGSYFASTPQLQIDTQFQGLKGFFTGESISFVKVSGVGQLYLAAFGRIEVIDVEDEVTVDTGHVVAFQDCLEYTIGKAGGSWIQSWLAGEGIVMHFSGRGQLLVQSHNLKEFGKSLGPLLPSRS